MLQWIRVLVLAVVAAAPAWAANDWVTFATVSPTTTLTNNHLCYSDGIDIACSGRSISVSSGGLLTAASMSTGGLAVSGATGLNTLTTSGYISASSLHTSGTVLVSGSTYTQDLFVRGALYVSGSQTIDGVSFANGGVSATGTVTATSFYGDGSNLSGVTASSMDWFGLTNIPAQVIAVSDSGNLALASVGVTGAVTASTLSGTHVNGRYVSATQVVAITGSFGNAVATGYLRAPLISSTAGGVVSGTYLYGQYASLTTLTAGTLSGDGSGLTNLNTGGFDDDRIVSGTTQIVAHNNAAISFTTAGSQRMVLTSGGLLGIATESPMATLDVSGTLKVAGTGSETCDSNAYGTFRRNPSSGKMEICRE